MAIKKLCSHGSCHRVVCENTKYCDKHQKQFEMREKERYKEYDKRRREVKEKKKHEDFYSSDEWKRIRQAVISECYGIDIYMYYETGLIVRGETVHHIVELEEEWDSRLDLLNLIYLTEKNHRKIHAIYELGEKQKKKMQKKLLDMLIMFAKEFG